MPKPKTKIVNIKLPDRWHKGLKALSKSKSTTVAQLFRSAIEIAYPEVTKP